MANGHGGYRQPSNPAPVSGPGALSARTDGTPRGPVPGAAPTMQSHEVPMQGPDLSSIVPLGAPSTRPEEPIQAGMPTGAGPGGVLPPAGGLDEHSAERLRSYLPVLIFLASSPDADSATKQYVRQLRGELG